MSFSTKQLYSGVDVLKLASELAETAALLAKNKGIAPKDARLALEVASQVIISKKESPAVVAERIASVITEIRSIQLVQNPRLASCVDELINAVDCLIDEQ